MRPYEQWERVATRLAVKELDLPEELFLDSLVSRDDTTRRVVEETVVSSCFPGIYNFCRTHIVRWEISDQSIEFYKGCGLFVELEKEEGNHPQQFAQCRHGRLSHRRWVPEKEVGNYKAHNYNFGQTHVDDAWVKYAIHKDGIVQFPPTEVSLTVLLRRTGIDISKFGIGHCKTLHDLWVELLNQASYLQMDRGKPTRVLEGTFVRIRMQMSKQQSDSPSPWHVLVKREVSTEDKQSKTTMGLMRTGKKKEETWEDAAMRCVTEELNCSRSKFKGAIIPSDGNYRYFEEVRESRHFPGMRTVYRNHLVTYTVSEDIFRVLEVKKYSRRSDSKDTAGDSCHLPTPGLEKASSRERPSGGRFSLSSKASSDSLFPGDQMAAEHGHNNHQSIAGWLSSKRMMRDSSPPRSRSRPEYTWLEEREAEKQVDDLRCWASSQKDGHTHHISSVLIGLEGAAPNCKSPFGSVHNAKGSSNKVSALGNRKWRAYRLNNALQIPSTEGGMRMKINKEMFQELIEACDDICLMDPSSDLLMKPHRGLPRSFLNQRHAEKEFYKQILGGSSRQARNAVDWMRKYCSVHRCPDQAYMAMHRQQRNSSNQSGDGGLHRMIPSRRSSFSENA